MTVRIQVIKVFDIDVPDGCKDPIAFAYNLQTSEIEKAGRFVDVLTDNTEVVSDDDEQQTA